MRFEIRAEYEIVPFRQFNISEPSNYQFPISIIYELKSCSFLWIHFIFYLIFSIEFALTITRSHDFVNLIYIEFFIFDFTSYTLSSIQLVFDNVRLSGMCKSQLYRATTSLVGTFDPSVLRSRTMSPLIRWKK